MVEKVLNDFRQGEVRLKEVETIPENAKKIKGGEVLAVGKSNLHSHRLKGSFQILESDSKKYVVCNNSKVTLVHEEHKAISLPKGKYLVQIQREYVPRQEARKVID